MAAVRMADLPKRRGINEADAPGNEFRERRLRITRGVFPKQRQIVEFLHSPINACSRGNRTYFFAAEEREPHSRCSSNTPAFPLRVTMSVFLSGRATPSPQSAPPSGSHVAPTPMKNWIGRLR